jgi:hydroxymethylbilane synthase
MSNTAQRLLRLGTRRSMLAWAQSSWVARQVETLNPGVQVELVGIETAGDKILDVPLSQIEGKEFFVAELDRALERGEVDFAVHSMKDLSLTRPPQFTLAAVPERENPRDCVIFSPRVLETLKQGRALRIGTSAPRRLENIPGFLEKALPRFGETAPRVQIVEIRGNVNTRLSRVLEPEGSPRHLDGVVLAFAGLARLWMDAAGQKELERLLGEPGSGSACRWMLLPLSHNPTAPAQGALAVECRKADAFVVAALEKLDHAKTRAAVQKERDVLAKWGGGCHQRFGASCVDHQALGLTLIVKGVAPDGQRLNSIERPLPKRSALNSRGMVPWNGSAWRAQNEDAGAKTVPVRTPTARPESYFVAHWRALDFAPADLIDGVLASRVWVSGVSTWFRLAQRGVWVEGCAESMGFDWLRRTLAEEVLRLPAFGSSWGVLTHKEAAADWSDAQVMATYEVLPVQASASEAVIELARANVVYWSSGSQFEALVRHVKPGAVHCCGAGKTAKKLTDAGLKPLIFRDVEEWREWLKN